MGRYKNSKLFYGTNGNKQLNIEQNEYYSRIAEISKNKKSDLKSIKKVNNKNNDSKTIKKVKSKEPIFNKEGTVTLNSISKRREFFLGKSVAKIENVLNKNGYETKRRPSNRSTSHAKIIVTLNQSKERNIQQVQVSPGSKRHGNVPYVKISTSNIGKIKIIGSSKENYKSDEKEKAKLLFRRNKK